MEETGQQAVPSRAPPASKKVVASLPKETLTEERLQELGGPDVRCPVCMEDLAVGDEVQVMPCNAADGKHVFHPPCLAPWLAENNSCPTCRHELPTDDHQYERRKEREREEAEERRGAENAVSHNEFLYI
jgi:E3 ubiquitin-protein ligase AIP2